MLVSAFIGIEKMKEISGICVDLCGSGMGINSSSRNIGNHVILDTEKSIEVDDSFNKISTDHDIYYSESLASYICFDAESHEIFSKDYSIYASRNSSTIRQYWYDLRKLPQR